MLIKDRGYCLCLPYLRLCVYGEKRPLHRTKKRLLQSSQNENGRQDADKEYAWQALYFAAFAFARLCRIRPPTRRTRQNSAQKKAESFCLLPHLRHEKRMTYAFFSYILSGACMPRRDKPFLSTVRAAFTARRRAFCSERLSLITRRSI